MARYRPATGMGRSAEAAWEAVVAVGMGLLIGYYADRWLGTEPWLLLAFLGLGLATGFQRLLRLLRQNAPAPDADGGSGSGDDSERPGGGRP